MQNFSLDRCFEYPFVGLYGCNLPDPVSGLYVNDLPGISIKRFSELTDAESPRIKDKFKAIHRQALQGFFFDLDTSFKDVEFDSTDGPLVTVGQLGELQGCIDYSEIGYRVHKRNKHDPFLLLHIADITFNVCADSDVKVTVYDQGEATYTKLHQVKAGAPVTLNIDYATQSNSVEVVVGCDVPILDEVCNSCCGYCDDTDCMGYYCPCFVAEPIMKATGTSIFTSVSSNGMKISGACLCDPTTIYCKYRKQLAVPFQYRLGIEILEDAMHSDNITPLTTCGQKSIAALMRSWVGFKDKDGRWIPGKYTTSKNRVIKYISNTLHKSNSACINCTGVHYQKEVY